MMEDLLNFRTFKETLGTNGFRDIKVSENSIFCKAIICEHTIGLKGVLPETFPYEFPTIYIDEQSYANISPLPHIGSDFDICTFDKSTVIPNFKSPTQLLLASFVKAREIIRQGIAKENIEDFAEEFCSYWIIDCDSAAESILTLPDKPTTICAYYSRQTKKVYLSNRKKELDHYLGNIGIKKRYLNDYHDCLYLPLCINISPPFPNTNYGMYKLIQSDKTVSSAYDKFLKARLPGSAFIAFSMLHSGYRCLQLFVHTNVSYSTNGFRKGRLPIDLAFLRDTKKTAPVKFLVEDMRQERLFTRGGTGIMGAVSKVAIIGCGSVGSYIVEALSEYGILSFIFVDNDKLSAENIARHYCGYEYVGKKKATALKEKLCKHNPNIKSEIYAENGLLFIQNHAAELNSCDLIFVATANLPLEYKIVSEVCAGTITKPVILTWVEPLLAAGHAILLNKQQDIFSSLFDEEYTFSGQVITNGENFQKKEFGCQSTYIPYGAFDLKRFIYEFLSYLLFNNIPKEKKGNYLFTWCGNIPEVQKAGGIIAPKWSDASPYSSHIKRID